MHSVRARIGCFRRAAEFGVALCSLSSPLVARDRRVPLDEAMRTLSQRSHTEIVSFETGLRRTRVLLPLSTLLPQALDQMLVGTDYRAIRIGPTSFRIEHAPRPKKRDSRTDRARRDADSDIVVTGSKSGIELKTYPGSVTILSPKLRVGSNSGPVGLDDLGAILPVLQTTDFGAGRNKVFIRGIADSSFNGATTSTAGIYFGDASLGFGNPSPSLKLIDVGRIEVLEGPQGTLYGAGSIGGIIRIVPNPVNLTTVAAMASGGTSLTAGGAPGFDAAAAVNLPIVHDDVGIRLVGYGQREGGYIDDIRLGANRNQVDTIGGRANVEADIDEFHVEFGGLVQDTHARDAQYSEVLSGDLRRSSRVAQPYFNRVLLGRIVVTKSWDSRLTFTSATSLGDRSARDQFDASSRNIQLLGYQVRRTSTSFAQEVRLAKNSSRGRFAWVVGASVLRDRDAQARALGSPDTPAELDEVTNVTNSASVFGQATLPIARKLDLTLGARATSARTDSKPGTGVGEALIRGRSTLRVDPTAALLLHLSDRFSAFARVQTGYRTGGLAVARGVGRVADFAPDSIVMGEVGLRRSRSGAEGLAFSTALSFAHWTDIQADLITRRGLPYTTNLGDADIASLEATADYAGVSGLSFELSALLTRNRLRGQLASQSLTRDQRLPETPPFAAIARITWHPVGSPQLILGSSLRYVGRSVLGPGAFLDISQGDYTVAGLSGSLQRERVQFSLGVDNVTNTVANRFAFGNPLTLSRRDQSTPLQPRTLRFGATWTW